MRPEIEAALAPLNWPTVRLRFPARAQALALTFNQRAADLSPRFQRRNAEQLEALMAGMAATFEAMAALSPEMANRINLQSTPPVERDGGWPDHLEAAGEALRRIVPGVLAEVETARHFAGPPKRGQEPNVLAYRVAEAIAEIHVLGLGQRPTIGRGGTGEQALGTQFGRAVEAVFDAMGLRVGEPFRPASAAARALRGHRLDQLLALHRDPLGDVARLSLLGE